MVKNRIVFKITFGYTLVTLISLLIVGLLFINLFKEYTFNSREGNMINRSREISRVSGQYISQEGKMEEYKSFMELLGSSANAGVWILDKSGNLVINSKGAFCNDSVREANMGVIRKAKEIQDVLKGQEVNLVTQGVFYNISVITVGTPVYGASGDILGAVFLHSPVIGITDTIDKAFLFLISGILLAIVLSILLGTLYSNFITKPLKLMNNAAIEMTRGNYGIRTNIYQKDEIGQLGSSLDLLSSKLGFTLDQLFQEKGKLSDIINSISEGILAFDSNMTLTNYNRPVITLLDYRLGEDISSLLEKDLKEQGIWDELSSAIKNAKGKSLVCGWSLRRLKFTLSPVKNNTGETTGVVTLIQDISENERLEQMRKDFVANVSHELRTPLTLIKGSVEALIDKAVNEPAEVERYHNRILDESNSLERLVTDLMDLGKIQSGKFPLNFENIDMNSLVLETVNSFKAIGQRKRIDILIEAAPDIPQINGDYDRLRQLLIIFLDNAVKYSEENTKIIITTEVKDYLYIKIKDNGIGIPKEDIPFVWERFYKVDKSRKGQHLGSGLGLAIARYLVEAHYGVVWLESEVNKGTTVILGIPYISN